MFNHKYLIVGGGMAAGTAIKAILKLDDLADIGVLCDEDAFPYKRPMLSKKLWQGASYDSVWIKDININVDYYLSAQAVRINPRDKVVYDNVGEEYRYNKLLIATGGTPKRLPFGQDEIIYFRTIADYDKLRKITEKADRFVVIGGGFIGSEIAAALNMNGKKVTIVFPENYIGERVYPSEIANFITNYYRQKGIEILNGDAPVAVESVSGDKKQIKTKNGVVIEADAVIAGIGIVPNVKLAEDAGLEVDNGILVDEYLRTANQDIYAAGDVANFYNFPLNKRTRVEHEDNANIMGKYAGNAMAGHSEVYHYMPYFYTDMFDLGYEAIGELDSRLQTYCDWIEPYQKGTIYYINDGRVRGVLAWNLWDKMDEARDLIKHPGPFTPSDLKGKIK